MPTKSLTADEIAEAIRAGSSNYTAGDLAAARSAEEFEALRLEARSREEIARIEQERAAEIGDLHAQIEAIDRDVDTQLEHIAVIMGAFDDLVAAVQARANLVAELGARARQLGVAAVDAEGNARDDGLGLGPLGWKWDRVRGRVGRLRVGDRVISSADPRAVLNLIVGQLVARHKLDAEPAKTPHGVTPADLIRSQDTVVSPPVMVTVRLLERHGSRPAGGIYQYDLTLAEWLIKRNMAVPV